MKKISFKQYVRIYFMIISQDMKGRMQYRADFIISSIGMLAGNISGLISFWLLFQAFPTILGWTYNEIVFLYGFTLLALTPVQLFFDNIWKINGHVYRGSFIKYCFRPINVFFYYVSDVFDVKGLAQLVFGMGVLIYGWAQLGLEVTVGKVLLLTVALISASMVMVAMMVLASSSAFWIMNATSVLNFMFRFKDYAKYPMTIFSPVFKFVFSFIIPVGFVAYYPSLLFLRPSDVDVMAYLSPVMGVAFFFLAYKVWMRGASQYSGTGN